jgi:hypothetical protein
VAELSDDEVTAIVERVTANVLRELQSHGVTGFGSGEIRLPLTDLTRLGEEVSWAPWTVALPPDVSLAPRTGPE